VAATPAVQPAKAASVPALKVDAAGAARALALADAAMARGDANAAHAQYMAALVSDRWNRAAMVGLARIYVIVWRKYADGLPYLDSMLATYPDDQELLRYRAEIYLQLHMVALSRADLLRALPQVQGGRAKAQVHSRLASLDVLDRHYDKALEQLNQGIALEPEDADYRYLRAALACELKRWDVVREDEAKLVALGKPTDRPCGMPKS
jgi:tetratricopeptide (TPR) repeat protein